MIDFDAATHTYTKPDTGERLPSVTQIIRAIFQVQGWGFNRDAADRGEAVHRMCQLISEGDPTIEERVHPDLLPFGRAWRRAINELIYRAEHWELAMASSLGFAGRLDTCGTLMGRPTLLDIKSGSLPAWVGVQLAAYDMLYRENHPGSPRMSRRAIQLESDGSYTCHSGVNIPGRGWSSFDDSYWDTLWMSALNVFRSGFIKEAK